jgi:hypothetical protein
MHPASTKKKRLKLKILVLVGVFSPAPPSKIAGIIRPIAKSLPEPRLSTGTSAACAPLVATVSTDVPVLFATEIVPSEQVGAGLDPFDTLQVSATVDRLSPPSGLIVIVDFADAPGATEAGNRVPAEMLKSGAVTTKLTAVEVLPLKLLSPPYPAVMLWVPAVSVEVEKVATPFPPRAELPSGVVPSTNVTVPEGTPAVPGATAAVKVTV